MTETFTLPTSTETFTLPTTTATETYTLPTATETFTLPSVTDTISLPTSTSTATETYTLPTVSETATYTLPTATQTFTLPTATQTFTLPTATQTFTLPTATMTMTTTSTLTDKPAAPIDGTMSPSFQTNSPDYLKDDADLPGWAIALCVLLPVLAIAAGLAAYALVTGGDSAAEADAQSPTAAGGEQAPYPEGEVEAGGAEDMEK